MRRIVRGELAGGLAIGILTLLAVGLTGTGAGGAYLFGIGFVTIALLIKRHYESVP